MVDDTRVDAGVVDGRPVAALEGRGLLNVLLGGMTAGVIVASIEGRVVFVSDVAADLVAIGSAEATGAHLWDVLPLSAAIVVDGVTEATIEVEHRTIEVDGRHHADPDGESWFVLTLRDVTRRVAEHQDLEHRATHDALTGLCNRAWLIDDLQVRIARGDSLVLAFVDLDRFKAVNDRLGHESGDAVLTDVANALQRCLHLDERVARVGGDEFVVVATDLDEDQLADLDVRIRLAVATVPSARRHGVGVSVGLARSEPGEQPWDLLERADHAMYMHKRRAERRSGKPDRRR